MSTGTRIRRAREQKGYSQRDMADRLAMSQNNYHKIENDQIKVKAEDLLKIAQTLEADVNDLLQDERNVLYIKHSTNSQTANNLFIEQSLNENERKLYEQLLQSKEQMLQSKDELLASQAKLLAQYEAEIAGLRKQLAEL